MPFVSTEAEYTIPNNFSLEKSIINGNQMKSLS